MAEAEQKKTELLFQTDTYLSSTSSVRVVSCRRLAVDSQKAVLILEKTIFYPQGGGQPSDTGTIVAAGSGETSSPKMVVTMVRTIPESGQVEHEGSIEGDELFQENSLVDLAIDSQKRLLHARIHTGGHLLDHAAQMLRLPIVGTKGYHFPAGPYVEYSATPEVDVSVPALAQMKRLLEEQTQQLIADGRAVTVEMVKPDQLPLDLKATLPAKALQSEYVRLVAVYGTPAPLPCGGTHVANTREMGLFTIKKLSAKGGVLRVSYVIA